MDVFAIALALLQSAPPSLQSPPTDWRTRHTNAGVWTWRSTPEVSEASFADSRGTQFVIRCTRATRRVKFSRPGAPVGQPIRIATTSSERQLPPGNMLLASDPLLDAISFSRGRLWVDVAGVMPLVLRSAPEPARAVEDCRS